MDTLLIVIIAFWALLNSIACLFVQRANLYTASQKRNQIILVWCFPFFGSLLCLFVLRETNRKVKRSSFSNSPMASPPGVGSYNGY